MTGPTAEQLETQVEAMEREVAKLEDVVETKMGAINGPGMVDPKVREKERKELDKVKREMMNRRKQFEAFWEALTENYEGDKEALWVLYPVSWRIHGLTDRVLGANRP